MPNTVRLRSLSMRLLCLVGVVGVGSAVLSSWLDTIQTVGTGSYHTQRPDISFNASAGRYLAVWEEPDLGEISAAIRTEAGALVKAFTLPGSPVHSTVFRPRVAWSTGDSWLVVYEDSKEVLGCRVSKDGAILWSGIIANNPTFGAAGYADVGGGTDGKYLIVWQYEFSLGLGYKVMGRVMSAAGTLGDEFEISSSGTTPSVNQRGANFLVAWEKHLAGTPEEQEIWARYVAADGSMPVPAFSVEGGGFLEAPSVAARLDSAEFLVACTYRFSAEDHDIHVATTSGVGVTARTAATIASTLDINPFAAFAGVSTSSRTEYLVGWAAGATWTGNFDVYATPITSTATGLTVGALETVAASGNSEGSPEGTTFNLGSSRVLVTWDAEGSDYNKIRARWWSAVPPTCTSFSIDPVSVNVSYEAGSQKVAITGSPAGCSGGSWSTSGNGVWLTVNPASSSGPGSATATWLQNPGTEPRSGSALIAGRTFSVTQGAAPQPTLSVSGGGAGTGTISSQAGLTPAINCITTRASLSGTCSQNYTFNTSVKLTAFPASGHTFNGWSGDCGGVGDCQVTMDRAHSVTASFTPGPQTLTVTGAGTGNGGVTSEVGLTPAISCVIDKGVAKYTCSQAYPYDTRVKLSALEASGYKFTGWGGACASAGTTPTCTVAMTEALSVSASFGSDKQRLVVEGLGTGNGKVTSQVGLSPAINCTSTAGTTTGACTQDYPASATVRLTAQADPGHVFVGWDGYCSGTTNPCAVPMSEARNVFANFGIPRSLTVTGGGSGNGTITSQPGLSPAINCTSAAGSTSGTCAQDYSPSAIVTLTATEASGHAFTGWGGYCSFTTEKDCTVYMSEARLVVAYFAPPGAMAAYDSTLEAPACSVQSPECDSGTLLNGRGTLSGGAEPHQPNTLGSSCADGSVGTYHVDESIDRVRVVNSGSGLLTAGYTARIEVTMWAYNPPDGDYVDLYYTNTPASPNWVFLATRHPASGGKNVIALDYTLPTGTQQAVRARFRFNGSAAPCGVGDYGDHDDLVFTVAPSSSVQALTITGGGTGAGSVTSQAGLSPAVACTTTAAATAGTCIQSYPHGTTVVLTASPAIGHVFTGWSGGPCSGTGQCAVTMTQARGVVASFSGSEGTARIFFSSNRTTAAGNASGTLSHIWQMRPDATGVMQVTSGADNESYPSLSPDGTRLLFSRRAAGSSCGNSLWVRVLGTGAEAQVTAAPGFDDSQGRWSADGTRIAFQRKTCSNLRSAIVTLPYPSSPGTSATSVSDAAYFYAASPSWSPDGTAIVYAGTKTSGSWSSSDVTEVVRVTLATGVQAVLVSQVMGIHEYAVGGPLLSPDGTKLAYGYSYLDHSNDDRSVSRLNFYNLNPDGSLSTFRGSTVGTGSSGFSWSLDSKGVVETRWVSGYERELWTTDDTGGNPVKIAASIAESRTPVWAHGGSSARHLVPVDFDGDKRSDVAVYRPSSGTWFWLDSSTGNSSFHYRGWGVQAQGDRPVAGDFDGDGILDPTVFRPAGGTWFILKSSTNYTDWAWFGWGESSDILVPGDYDGDDKTDAAVYRPSSGTWYVRPSSGAAPWNVAFGNSTDTPIAGDFDGDRKRDPAVYRSSTGTWFWLKSSTNLANFDYRGWGVNAQGDTPAPGDYDGDGTTDLCVFRPATGTWYILESESGYTTWSYFGWGQTGDTVVPADYDGDGATDGAIYRASAGTWYIRPSSGASAWTKGFGQAGDQPLVTIR